MHFVRAITVAILTTAVAPFYPFLSPAQSGDPRRVVILGDSVIWGQGLREDEKIHSRLLDMLRNSRGLGTPNISNLAHSGATIQPDNTPWSSALHPEIPASYPTILEQCGGFHDSPGTVGLVLLNGGVNDVNARQILHPFVPATVISQLVERHCHQGMTTLLTRASVKFPSATIVVCGYYSFISEETPPASLLGLLTGAGVIVDGFWSVLDGMAIEEGVAAIVTGLEKDTMVAKSRLFAEESTAKLKLAVEQVNLANRALGRGTRIIFADPRFHAWNAALATDSWLFALRLPPDDWELSPEDPVAGERIRAIAATILSMRSVPSGEFVSVRASMGHPNQKGAQACADAIFAALENSKSLVWVDFSASSRASEDGTLAHPHQTLTRAVQASEDGGTILIKAGSTAETPVIAKACRLEAYGGRVIIGR